MDSRVCLSRLRCLRCHRPIIIEGGNKRKRLNVVLSCFAATGTSYTEFFVIVSILFDFCSSFKSISTIAGNNKDQIIQQFYWHGMDGSQLTDGFYFLQHLMAE